MAWPALRRSDWLPIAVMLAVTAVVTVPRLPPGVCFSDGGDLQVASATLGIMHPPGYTGYVTLGYLVSRLPGVDPAYMISIACLGAGLVALALCALLQVRLGVNPYLASAVALAISAHDRIWKNLLAPEVYMPTLSFVLAAAYLLLRFARLGRSRDLYWATLCFGVALGNRPTVIWMLPFLLAAWFCAERSRKPFLPRWRRRFLLASLCAVLPGLYSLGYLWVRDTPKTLQNYIDHHNAEVKTLPDASAGWQEKLKRLYYHASAREFVRYMGRDWHGVRMRLRWLYLEFFLYQVVDFLGLSLTIGSITFLCVAVLLAAGFVLVFRRSRTGFWILLGMMLGNGAFICTYRIYGLAADLLPLMFAAAVLGGVALSPLFVPATDRIRGRIAVLLLLLTCAMTAFDVPRRGRVTSADATWFLAGVDMQTLPRDAVICSTWRRSTPLWYAKHILTKRRDVDIINTTTYQWRERIEALPQRPVFTVRNVPSLEGYTVTPYRVTEDGDGNVHVLLWGVQRPTDPAPGNAETDKGN